jgi:hypothetical protein
MSLELLCNIPSCNRKVHTDDFCKKHSKKYKYHECENCPVCFESTNSMSYPLLDCGHWVHLECILQSYKLECPVCRTPVSKKHLTHQQYNDFVEKCIRDEEEKQFEVRRNIRENELVHLRQRESIEFLAQAREAYNTNSPISRTLEYFHKYLYSDIRIMIHQDLNYLQNTRIKSVSNTAKVLQTIANMQNACRSVSDVDTDVYFHLIYQLFDNEYKIYQFCRKNLGINY